MSTQIASDDTSAVRVCRYSGDPQDKDIFLLRFESSAQQNDYTPCYDGSESHNAVPNNATVLAAMPETTYAERAEKKELQRENDQHQKRHKKAYHFVIQSLDAQTALAVQNEAPDPTNAKAAYDAMQHILNDQGVITQMSLVMQLLQIRCEDGSDPLQCMRTQSQLATKVAATGCALPEPLMKSLLLFSLPAELQHLRTKYIDAEERPGVPMTLSTLRQRLTTQFQSAAMLDADARGSDVIVNQVNQVTSQKPLVDDNTSTTKQFTPEQMEAILDLVSKRCIHCGFLHSSEFCKKKFPHLRPQQTNFVANAPGSAPMF